MVAIKFGVPMGCGKARPQVKEQQSWWSLVCEVQDVSVNVGLSKFRMRAPVMFTKAGAMFENEPRLGDVCCWHMTMTTCQLPTKVGLLESERLNDCTHERDSEERSGGTTRANSDS